MTAKMRPTPSNPNWIGSFLVKKNAIHGASFAVVARSAFNTSSAVTTRRPPEMIQSLFRSPPKRPNANALPGSARTIMPAAIGKRIGNNHVLIFAPSSYKHSESRLYQFNDPVRTKSQKYI